LIITIFITLLALIFILIITGAFLDDAFFFAAFGLLAITGSIIIETDLSYTTGSLIQQNYTYNPNETINQMNEQRTDLTTTYSDTWNLTIGIICVAIAIMGSTITFLRIRGIKKGKK
jgi:hypothetical protein